MNTKIACIVMGGLIIITTLILFGVADLSVDAAFGGCLLGFIFGLMGDKDDKEEG